jgi:hypothetical protein
MPPTWATPPQTAFLVGYNVEYLKHQKSGRLDAFWPAIWSAWCAAFPLDTGGSTLEEIAAKKKVRLAFSFSLSISLIVTYHKATGHLVSLEVNGLLAVKQQILNQYQQKFITTRRT